MVKSEPKKKPQSGGFFQKFFRKPEKSQNAEKLIADREQEKTIFDDEQRNLIVNFAFKLDDRAATEELVNGLAAALAEDDKEEVNRLMYDAQEKIENLPDGMIGLSEMHDYGYRKDDVLPLTKEGAREWHRLGERIYPLFRDGTAGDYASQEGIEQHDGIFGIKADAWDAILLEQREDYAEDEYARPDFQLTVINREQALRLYDEGKQIYLVRISPWPILVTAREEIERGSDTFQIVIADLEQVRNMTEQENMLLNSGEKQFGIYQITAREPEHDYRFMGLDYVQKKGITVARADYDLIYTAPLTEKDTLDGIYERFNIQRPADFTGHSLSVSDVVVLNDGSTVKAYYVDSIGFAELPGFFKERNMNLQKEDLLNEALQEIEIFDKPGLFSNGRLRDEDVPKGLYRYDLRGSDYDPGQPIIVEKTVVVNHAASVLMAEELDLGAEGRLELGEEGLNFTGAELTVREFMEEQQQKNNALIHGDSYHIAVEGHIGTWYAIDETEIGGEKFFLMEHEEHGDMAACVAVNEQGKLVAEDLWNGFDEDFQEAVQKYLSEKWNGDIQKEEQGLKEAHKKASRRKILMEQKLKNLKGEKMRMYEEYAAGTLSLDTYKQKKQECDRRISEVQEQIEQSKAEESTKSVVPGTVRAAAEQAENFLNGTRLTASMVSAFIENVFVYDGGRIVVRFKYEQSIQNAVKALHTD